MRVERALWLGLNQLWKDFKLDRVFQQEGASKEAIVLWEAEAPPGAALPYCVVESLSYSVSDRASGRGSRDLCEVRDYVFRIHVFAESRESVSRLGISIQQAFNRCKGMTLGDRGSIILMELGNAYIMKDGPGLYHGVLQYRAKTDVLMES